MTHLRLGATAAHWRRRVASRWASVRRSLPPASVTCLVIAGSCFLATTAAVTLARIQGDGQPPTTADLIALLAFGMAWCTPTLVRLIDDAAENRARSTTPSVPPQLPVALPRVPEPLWRCLEPLPDDGSPLPQQVARRLGEAVSTGRLLPGTSLPTDRHLAQFYQVSVSTIRRAKAMGNSAGFLHIRFDGAMFVAAQPIEPSSAALATQASGTGASL